MKKTINILFLSIFAATCVSSATLFGMDDQRVPGTPAQDAPTPSTLAPSSTLGAVPRLEFATPNYFPATTPPLNSPALQTLAPVFVGPNPVPAAAPVDTGLTGFQLLFPGQPPVARATAAPEEPVNIEGMYARARQQQSEEMRRVLALLDANTSTLQRNFQEPDAKRQRRD